MHNLIVAVALLGEPDDIEATFQRIENTALMETGREYWLSLGVMEDNEYYFKNPDWYESDREVMEWRFWNTPPDAPHFTLVNGALPTLPSLPHINEMTSRGRNYIRYLRDRQDWALAGEEFNEYEVVIQETERRMEVWGKLHRCQGNYFGRDGRRFELDELRRMCPEGFDTGRWPDPLPPVAYQP